MDPEEKLALYHERVLLPLYQLRYDVCIGKTMNEVQAHMATIYPGLDLQITSDHITYSCVVSHPTAGSKLMLLIATEGITESDCVEGIIAHECTNLSWQLLDQLSISINLGNHNAQSYLMGELMMQVLRIYKTFEESGGDLTDL